MRAGAASSQRRERERLEDVGVHRVAQLGRARDRRRPLLVLPRPRAAVPALLERVVVPHHVHLVQLAHLAAHAYEEQRLSDHKL